ncbi:hypothetical protein [Hydrogenivirga sp. 128-5-R1-1]|uniref:tetratricopeptide repeat-containing glycosyltransferase n=1 Tax=Hydrogenivirga sp. 128-5-R1-1 TaxID=392423 RepID=UPI00015F2F7F|nr:hypothetical protein [Hydrogenivirga sp. 128-5-R1-1]EDP73747.1 hypothetical protein HG1285_10335 [Hydrogenivirga sp. 128-5-R1-1]
MKVSVCILEDSKGFLQETLENIEGNEEYINEIIYSGNTEDLSGIDTDYDIKCLNINSENKAFLRNKLLENANNEYILWLKTGSILEEDTFEEYEEILEEFPDVDIIYPNEILIDLNNEENIKNFKDWYKNELELLQGLTLEKYLPEFGVLTKKSIFEKFGKFDEEFEDYEFYRFLSLNLKNITLKLSEFSFTTNKITKTFIDTSFHSKNLRDLLKIYSMENELFPELNWKNEKIAKATAFSITAGKLKEYFDYYNAAEFYKKALLTFHNQYSLKELIDTYMKMGEFEKAKYMLEEQGLKEKEILEYEEKIQNIEDIIDNLESAVKEGKIKEVLSAVPDVLQFYEGAPIYNILGVIHYIGKDMEGAFKFFYKAITMNPLNDDYRQNLFDIAKLLNKEEKVNKLIQRLLSD